MSKKIDSIKADRDKALQHIKVGEFYLARELLGSLSKTTHVSDFTVHLGLAVACSELGDASAAEVAADKALSIEGRNLQALLLKARLLYARQNLKGALSYCKAALSHPDAERTSSELLKRELAFAREIREKFIDAMSTHIDAHTGKSALVRDDGKSTRFGKAIDLLLGRRAHFQQQPQQLFFPELPIVEVFDSMSFEWVAILERAFPEIRSEAESLLGQAARFEPYVQPTVDKATSNSHGMTSNKDWSALYLVKDGEFQLENASLCPHTVKALDTIPMPNVKGRMPSVLFSLLRPHARIPPHTGMLNTRLICHLPLIVPDSCGLRVGGEIVKWQEGKVLIFDDSIEHEAWNASNLPRLVLIFEIWRPELTSSERASVSALFEAMDKFDMLVEHWGS